MPDKQKVYDVEVSGMAWVTFRLRVNALNAEIAKKFLIHQMENWESISESELPEVISVGEYPSVGKDFSMDDIGVEEIDVEEEKRELEERREFEKAFRIVTEDE